MVQGSWRAQALSELTSSLSLLLSNCVTWGKLFNISRSWVSYWRWWGLNWIKERKKQTLAQILALRGPPQRTSFLSTVWLDVRQVGKDPKGYQKEKQCNQRRNMSSQMAVTSFYTQKKPPNVRCMSVWINERINEENGVSKRVRNTGKFHPRGRDGRRAS